VNGAPVITDEFDDLLTPAAVRDPYPLYARLRRAPVRWNERWRGWVVTGYPECRAVLRDAAGFSSRLRVGSDQRLHSYPNLRFISTWVSFVDPPDHTRLRGLMTKAFTPRAVEKLLPSMRRLAADLVAALPTGREIDLIRELTYPFPLRVIASLLGLPAADADRFKEWSDDLLPIILGGVTIPQRYAHADRALGELTEYLRAEIADRRRTGRDDLITAFVRARDGAQALTEDEIVGSCMILLFGGHETSSNLLAHALLALSRQPGQWALLRDTPALVGPAVEEFLRFDGPTKGVVRWAVTDTVLAGERIRAGQRVLALVAAANHDPRRFADPEVLRLDRAPNPHLEFGVGIHHCLGAALTRAEASVLLPAVLDRFDQIEIDDERLDWQPTMLSRSLRQMPVVLRERRVG
jgi:cytochrome P450